MLQCLFLPYNTGTMLSCRNSASFPALLDRIVTSPRILWLCPIDNQEKYPSFILQFCSHMFPQIVQSFRRGAIKMAGSVHVSTCLFFFFFLFCLMPVCPELSLAAAHSV